MRPCKKKAVVLGPPKHSGQRPLCAFFGEAQDNSPQKFV